MKTKLIKIAATALLFATSAANATLESRLSGKAYYDTDTGLTWAGPEYTVTPRTSAEQAAFLSTLNIGGIGDWRIPSSLEFFKLTYTHSHCSDDPLMCSLRLPDAPLDTYPASSWGYFTWVIAGISEGIDIIYGAYRPALLEGYPLPDDGKMTFSVWPVHTGDVPVIALVPEPQTYAMLLAGLGLVGFMGRKTN
jgi:hypothetical protein